MSTALYHYKKNLHIKKLNFQFCTLPNEKYFEVIFERYKNFIAKTIPYERSVEVSQVVYYSRWVKFSQFGWVENYLV